jgi:hypothetical protein
VNYQIYELKTRMIHFKGIHFPKQIILCAVFFSVRYATDSSRDLEDTLAERGMKVDHASFNRWVISYSLALALKAKNRKRTLSGDSKGTAFRSKQSCLQTVYGFSGIVLPNGWQI